MAEAQARFAGTTRGDFQVWTVADTLTKDVFDALSVYADGTRYTASAVAVRYPASFFGIRGCVYVQWSDAAVVVRRESGRACAVFIG